MPQHRVRRSLAVFAAVALVAALAVPGGAAADAGRAANTTVLSPADDPVAPSIQVVDLGTEEALGDPIAIDSDDDVLFPGGLLKHGTTALVTPAPPAAGDPVEAQLSDMNDSGVVVGLVSSTSGVDGAAPMFWNSAASSVYQAVAVPGATNSCIPSAGVSAIDAADEAVGQAAICPGGTSQGVFVAPLSTQLTLNSDYMSIDAITSDFEIASLPTTGKHVLIDRSGGTTTPLSVSTSGNFEHSLGVDGSVIGQVGGATPGGAVQTADGTVTNLQQVSSSLPGAGTALPDTINATGEIAGADGIRGVTWPSATSAPIDLNSLLPADSPWEIGTVYAMNDNGDLTGVGLLNGVREIYLVSTCDDDPSLSDGGWEYGGCFTSPDATDHDTQVQSSLDGLEVVPPSGEVDYDSSGDAVTPPSGTTLALDTSTISGAAVPSVDLTKAMAKLSLAGGPVTLTLPSGFTLFGQAMAGTLTLTPSAGGVVTGAGTATLPKSLGGGPATLNFVSALGKGVTAVTVTATAGSLAQLIGLTALKLSYAKGVWTVDAVATSKGAKQTLTGSLTYNGAGKLTAGSLDIANVVVAGLVTIKTFSVSYNGTKWSATASLAEAAQAAKVSFTFTTDGQLVNGSLSASGVTLFQVFTLKTFTLTYAATAWKLSIAVTGAAGTGVAANLSIVKGQVQGADLTFNNISLLGKVILDKLELHYSVVNGHDLFSGGAKVQLPGTLVSSVEGTFAFTDGAFTKGSFEVHGNVPLYGALELNKIGAALELSPHHEIAGSVGLSAGPKTAKGALLDIDGTLTYAFPDSTHPSGVYTVDGSLSTVGDLVLGEGKLTVEPGLDQMSLTLGQGGDGLKIGTTVELKGSVTAKFVRTSFTTRGTVSFELTYKKKKYSVRATVTISNLGVIACAHIPSLHSGESGIAYKWGGSVVAKIGDCAPANF